MLATINQNNKADEPLNKLARLENGEEGENNLNDKENQLMLKTNDNKEIAKRATTKRKKKLIIDEIKEIDSATMKTQLNDTSAIVST